MSKPPKVFISYCWTSEDYKATVLQLAEALVEKNVDVILDQWFLLPGHDRFAFMEQSIEKADKVLVLCDKKYCEKANAREGGVGTETEIITPEVYGQSNQDKFIPVVMEDFKCMPAYLRSRLGIDFRNGHRDQGFEDILRSIYNKPANIKPPLGNPPEWIKEKPEELQVEQWQKNVVSESDAYFEENAVMRGSVLEHFKGRVSTVVVIPEGVTIIGSRAFAFYPGLKGISIPSTVKRIDEYAFIKCPNLQSITVSPDNPIYRSENNCCIERSTNRLVFGCCNSVIPEGVNIINKDAFNGCESLTTINIPSSIIRIEEDAFFQCVNLKEINIEEGVAEIGELAFCDCYKLIEIRIPASVTKIADGAFYKCKSLQSIQVSDQNQVYYSENNCCIETITHCLIFGCYNSIIPEGVNSIANMAFIGCERLEEINLPISVVKIGKDAFRDCINLSSIVLPKSIERIQSAAFGGCKSIRNLFIPESVKIIEEGAFMGCAGIRSIKVDSRNSTYRSEDDCCIRNNDNVILFGCMNSIIPDGVTEITDYAFSGCSALDYIHIPESVIRIGCFAFSECYGLTEVSLAEGVERIESNAFEQCALTSLIFPRSVKYIGAFSFFDCYELTNIVLPNSVLYIGELAFSGSYSQTDRRKIFCGFSKKPDRWHREWADEDSDIYWKDEWHFEEDGIPVTKTLESNNYEEK